jgi:3-hydroxypropanoate dehydrogenase
VPEIADQAQTSRPPAGELPTLDQAGQDALFGRARTVSRFCDRPVSDEELRAIWSLAKWPPTSANTQPLRVLYIRSPEARERLIRHLNENNRPKTRSAPAVALLAVDLDFHEHRAAFQPERPELEERFADEEGRHRLARFNATLQVGYFLLAVRAMGLAAGPIGGFDTVGVDAEFFVGGRLRSLLVVNIGHPSSDPAPDRLPRLDEGITLRWV